MKVFIQVRYLISNYNLNLFKYPSIFNRVTCFLGKSIKIKTLEDSQKFEMEFDFTLLYHNNILYYILVDMFNIDEFPNSFKSCIIANTSQEKAKKLKCNMKLILNGKELVSYNGNIFSIDDTSHIHSWKSGGLIYPKEIIGQFPIEIENKIR